MLIVAHRGAHGPEAPGGPPLADRPPRPNTLAALRAAAAVADGVEFDVRRTADGALVIVHDPVVEGLVIAEHGRRDLPGWVPTLEEALEACAGMRYVDVEVKNAPHEPGFDPGPGLARQVAATVAHSSQAGHAGHPGRTAGGGAGATITCFHLGTVDAARAAGAPRTGWLTLPGYDQLGAVAEAATRGHTAIAPPDAATDAALVAAAHDRGLEVIVWTVNDPARAAELARWGVDACVTDRPGPVAAAAAASGSTT